MRRQKLECRYGFETLVVESHTSPGGAAHHWSRGQFSFDSGAALFSGINPTTQTSPSGGIQYETTANPLSSVLAAISETVPGVIDLDDHATCLIYPDGKQYRTQLGSEKFAGVVEERLGADAAREWRAFQASVHKLCDSAGAIPPAAVRLDPGMSQSLDRFAQNGHVHSFLFSWSVFETVQHRAVAVFAQY